MEQDINRVKFLLMNMGLNEYQASALSYLLYLGETKATTLSKASGVPNARVYGILEDLSQRGLVTVRPGRPALYSPMTPDDIAAALVADTRQEIRRRLRIVESYIEEFSSAAENVFLKAGKVQGRVPLLRIVSVGDVSIDETRKLYRDAQRSIYILTRAMDYFPEVTDELRAAVSREVDVKVLMMSDLRLSDEDVNRRNDMIACIKDATDGAAEIRVCDEVIIRGCIIDANKGGRALFLVEEVGVPFFLREAAITAHPGVVKGLASLFNLMWRYESRSLISVNQP